MSSGWDSPYFSKFVLAERIKTDEEQGRWLSWKEHCDALGTEVATALAEDGVLESKPWPGTDPKRQLKLWRRVFETDTVANKLTEGQKNEDCLGHVTAEAAAVWQQNASSFAHSGHAQVANSGGSGGKNPQKKGHGNPENKDPEADARAPTTACVAAIKKAVVALDNKCNNARGTVAQAAGNKYVGTLVEDIEKVTKRADKRSAHSKT